MAKFVSKRIVRDICQCIIGVIMLVLSYNYVQAHDAEKVNFVSGITVLKQKASSVVGSRFGKGSTQEFQRQQDMIRNYKEVLSYIKNTHCTLSVSADAIQEKLDTLSTVTPTIFAQEAFTYSSYITQVYEEMQRTCQK